MKLFRMKNGELLTQQAGEQFLTDAETGKTKLFLDFQGRPTAPNGTPIEGEFLTKFVYDFEEYARLYPEANDYRNWLGVKEKRGNQVVLMQGFPGWSCMPGYVYNVTLMKMFPHPFKLQYSIPPTVLVNDGDDFYARKIFRSDAEAAAGFEELKLMAPFTLNELTAFGYERE